MTLTLNGQPLRVHPLIATMITMLVEKQEVIWTRGVGSVHLEFAEDAVKLRVHDRAVVSAQQKIYPHSHARAR